MVLPGVVGVPNKTDKSLDNKPKEVQILGNYFSTPRRPSGSTLTVKGIALNISPSLALPKSTCSTYMLYIL